MSAKSLRCMTICTALLLSAVSATTSNAQCCGGATTAYYQPAAYTAAYAPVAYQTNYSTGWYPGYFLDRIRTRLWGSPSTYVAAYPSTYVASYPTTYAASYPSSHYASYPAYSAGYAASYAYPAASPCTTCASPCSTCTQQVTMRPVCETCTTCDPCSSCSSGSSYGVNQTSYEQSSGCATCGTGEQNYQQGQNTYQQGQSGTTIVVPNGTVVTPGAQQSAPSNGDSRPTLDPNVNESPRSTYEQQKPVDENPIVPEPRGENNGDELEKGFEGQNSDGSTYFEAPKLFNPKDRTAQRHIAPVRTALYEQPVEYHRASAVRTKVTAQQAAQDAIGWTSASN